ncbi:MAG TPA: hypothetical protein EYH31_03625, partial [Anaerolineae bacterium]|nr:hypothetical protein [Anaerolineae bacterium]
METSDLDELTVRERQFGLPFKWGLLLVGFLAFATQLPHPMTGGVPLGLVVYALAVIGYQAQFLLRPQQPLGRFWLWFSYFLDISFVCAVIVQEGITSPFYLVFPLLALKAGL